VLAGSSELESHCASGSVLAAHVRWLVLVSQRHGSRWWCCCWEAAAMEEWAQAAVLVCVFWVAIVAARTWRALLRGVSVCHMTAATAAQGLLWR
jgi:hypothetical protein